MAAESSACDVSAKGDEKLPSKSGPAKSSSDPYWPPWFCPCELEAMVNSAAGQMSSAEMTTMSSVDAVAMRGTMITLKITNERGDWIRWWWFWHGNTKAPGELKNAVDDGLHQLREGPSSQIS